MFFEREREREPSWYDVAQVCTNGHVVNASAQKYPQHNEKFCSKCGAPTLLACERCQASIRGEYHVPGVVGFSGMKVAPAYCHECGGPYSWTESRLKALAELIDLSLASPEEKEALRGDLGSLARETPRTGVVVERMRRLLKRIGVEGGTAIRQILTEVATAEVRKQLGL
jgi:hypothetical protein